MKTCVVRMMLGIVLLGALSATADMEGAETFNPRNLVWENKDFSDDWENVGFIGDGQQGASVLLDNENANDLRFLLSRYDIVEYPEKGYWPRVFAGNVIISPKGTVADRTMEQDLYTGIISGTLKSDKGMIEWKAFAEREHNVIVVGVRGQGGEAGAEPTYRVERPVDTRRYFVKSKHYKYAATIKFLSLLKPSRCVQLMVSRYWNNR